MKQCSDCNVEMLENCTIDAQHTFDLGVDGESEIYVHIPTNEKASFFGFKYDKEIEKEVKVRVCPKCGKVEMYIDINKE